MSLCAMMPQRLSEAVREGSFIQDHFFLLCLGTNSERPDLLRIHTAFVKAAYACVDIVVCGGWGDIQLHQEVFSGIHTLWEMLFREL